MGERFRPRRNQGQERSLGSAAFFFCLRWAGFYSLAAINTTRRFVASYKRVARLIMVGTVAIVALMVGRRGQT